MFPVEAWPFLLVAALVARRLACTSWTEYISNHNITDSTLVEKGRLERDHERFDSCWFAFARLPYRVLSVSPRDRQEHDGPVYAPRMLSRFQ